MISHRTCTECAMGCGTQFSDCDNTLRRGTRHCQGGEPRLASGPFELESPRCGVTETQLNAPERHGIEDTRREQEHKGRACFGRIWTNFNPGVPSWAQFCRYARDQLSHSLPSSITVAPLAIFRHHVAHIQPGPGSKRLATPHAYGGVVMLTGATVDENETSSSLASSLRA